MERVTIEMDRQDGKELLQALDAACGRAMKAARAIQDQDEEARQRFCEEAGTMRQAYYSLRAALR